MKQKLGLFIILIVMIGLFGSKRYAQGMADKNSDMMSEQQQEILLGNLTMRQTIPVVDCQARLRPKFIALMYAKNVDVLLPNTDAPIVWSPDGSKVATRSRSNDRTAGIWDAATGMRLHTLSHLGIIFSVAWSPDGSKVATASGDGTAGIWDVATGMRLHTLPHQNDVWNVVWSPDGTKVATASADRTVRIWDAATGVLLHTLQSLGYLSSSVAWSPDNSRVATVSNSNTAIIWDSATGARIHALQHRQDSQDSVDQVVWSPDGSKVATASSDGTAGIWDAATAARLHSLHHQNSVNSVAWSPDGSKVATASSDHTAGIWDAVTGVRLYRLPHQDKVLSVAWSSDGSKVATGSNDSTTGIWDAATGMRLYRLPHQGYFLSVAWSPDGNRLAIESDMQHSVALYNVDILNKIKKFIEAPNIDQCDLLQAFDNATKDKERIQATIEQWQTFTTFPKSVQEALRLYIKPPAEITLQEREAAFKQRQQMRAQKLTQPEQSDHNDDDNDGESSRGKEKMPRTQE